MRAAAVLVAALVVATTLTACSDGDRREAVKIVPGKTDGARPAAIAAPPVAVTAGSTTTVGPTAPSPAPPPGTGLDQPMPIAGDATDRPLPVELAHLKGLGGTSSPAEERKP